MSRAILLPTPGDPFLLKYWLENYSKYYAGEVDKLYVHLNTPMEKDVVEYEMDLIKKYSGVCIYKDHQIEHGQAINELLEVCKEDFVVLMEDDCFVFKSEIFNKIFKMVETEYDCVGSKRGSCSMEIMDKAKEIWGLDYSGYGDQGCNFWPNLFFTKKEILLNTDRNFGAKGWKTGEIVEPLNMVAPTDLCGDTFVNTSLQLRAKGYKLGYINQYHGSPNDLMHYEKRENLWDGSATWVHVGSLSSGVGGVLVNDIGVSLARRKIDLVPRDVQLPQSDINEWARRIQWWKTFYDNSDDKLPEFKQEYLKAIKRLQNSVGIHDKLIYKMQLIYKELGL